MIIIGAVWARWSMGWKRLNQHTRREAHAKVWEKTREVYTEGSLDRSGFWNHYTDRRSTAITSDRHSNGHRTTPSPNSRDPFCRKGKWHPSYKESVKQQRTPSFTGEVRRYVVQPFRLQSDLTPDQVKLHSPIDVSDNCSSSLVAPKHGTSEASAESMINKYSPVTTLVESSVIV